MFTGIVENTAKIVSFKRDKVLISSLNLTNLKIGESISVNGMCLTIEDLKDGKLVFHLSKESLKKSDLSLWKEGNIVNIEKACTPSTLMGGHIVTGHIDCIGKVKDFKRKEILKIEYPKEFSKYLVLKGSIAINGVSLTISNLKNYEFEVSIIPYTLKNTNILFLKKGDKVHLEFDILSKIVEKLISSKEVYR